MTGGIAVLTAMAILALQNASRFQTASAHRLWGTTRVAAPSSLVSSGFSDCEREPVRSALLGESGIAEIRGGDSDGATAATEEPSLDDKVHAAMRKLGLSSPAASTGDGAKEDECKDGACPIPTTDAVVKTDAAPVQQEQDVNVLAARLSNDLKVDESLAMAALGATSTLVLDDGEQRIFDEQAARDMIQQEMAFIETVQEDSAQVHELVTEGHDKFLARRALAFAEMNMDDARAILEADKMDAQEEQEELERQQQEVKAVADASEPPPMKTVTVDADFDPTKTAMAASAPSPPQAPPSARKEDVVFDAISDQVQALILESPVPVLVDVYADWCGPCKALTPVLEDMAVKGGGMFRLVKINSDNERAISGALEVTALPTVFGVRDGKIIHMFQGMPRSEEAMKNFMMGLVMPGAKFEPPVTTDELEKYATLSSKLAKTAGGAAFSFSARERLQDRMATRLEDLVHARNGDMADAEESAMVVRSLLSNVIRHPLDMKYRKVNLENKVIAAKVAQFPPCVALLKGVGFSMNADGKSMMLAKNKKVVNIAPMAAARDCIDKWVDQNRHKVAAAARKRRDEIERQRLADEKATAGGDESEEEEEEEEVDLNAATIRLRIEGKKKMHELSLRADDPLSAIVDALPVKMKEQEDVQITCAAKRLVVKSTDSGAMQKSLRSHGLFPTASVVVKIGDRQKGESTESLAERAATHKSRKKGSHTMQSIGVYSKDDNAKGELIDGGGGVWYEQDVSDDEPDATEMDEKEDGEEEQEDQDETDS